jgi:hypothetical protein
MQRFGGRKSERPEGRAVAAFLVASGLLLSGCAPDFTGSYEGALQTNITCPGDGSDDRGSQSSFTLSEVNNVIMADADGCIGIPASVKGNSADILPYDCPEGSFGPISSAPVSVTGGSLQLNGSDLSIQLSGKSGSGSNICQFSSIGTMHRISSL